MPGKLKWAPFGPTCINLFDLKLGSIRGIISEHAVAIGTVKTLFNPLRSSWLNYEAYPGAATANAKRCRRDLSSHGNGCHLTERRAVISL